MRMSVGLKLNSFLFAKVPLSMNMKGLGNLADTGEAMRRGLKNNG